MRHLIYDGVLAFCLIGALWLEPVLHVGVIRRWRRLILTLVVVVVLFAGWDIAAIAAGHWHYDRSQMTPVTLLGGLPLDELLFFLVVPFCSILGFEAVRKVLRRPAGDEVSLGRADDVNADAAPADDTPADAAPADDTAVRRGRGER